MEGEFNSLKYVHTYIPNSCPEPFGWGEVSSSQIMTPTPSIWFKFVRDFVGLNSGVAAWDVCPRNRLMSLPSGLSSSKVVYFLYKQ